MLDCALLLSAVPPQEPMNTNEEEAAASGEGLLMGFSFLYS